MGLRRTYLSIGNVRGMRSSSSQLGETHVVPRLRGQGLWDLNWLTARCSGRSTFLASVGRLFAAEREIVSTLAGDMDKGELRRAWDEVQEKIRPVLMEEWDPIGVNDVPEAADEYDGYIGGIYVLLRDGASDEQIAQHLSEIETKTMGLAPVERNGYLPLIARLRSLDLPTFFYPRNLDGG
jgi:hypothetical protein